MSADNGDDSLVIIIPFSFLLLPLVSSLRCAWCSVSVCIAACETRGLTESNARLRRAEIIVDLKALAVSFYHSFFHLRLTLTRSREGNILLLAGIFAGNVRVYIFHFSILRNMYIKQSRSRVGNIMK